MGVRDRLERLEESVAARRSHRTPPELDLFLKHFENARREKDGLEPVPLTPRERELQQEQNLSMLSETIPCLRRDPGWQSAEAQATLDE